MASRKSSAKTSEDRTTNILRDFSQQPANKRCFDCGQRGPTYVNVTVGSFVCTSCSGILRGLNPPHRVKSISMATFTSSEVEFITKNGNEVCRCVWLGEWSSPEPPEVDSREEQKMKDFLVRKYERKQWYRAPRPQDTRPMPNNTVDQSTAQPRSEDRTKKNTLVSIASMASEGTSKLAPATQQKAATVDWIQPQSTTPANNLLFDLSDNSAPAPVVHRQGSFSSSTASFGPFADFHSAQSPSVRNQAPQSSFAFQNSASSSSSSNVGSPHEAPSIAPSSMGSDRYAALSELDSVFRSISFNQETSQTPSKVTSTPSYVAKNPFGIPSSSSASATSNAVLVTPSSGDLFGFGVPSGHSSWPVAAAPTISNPGKAGHQRGKNIPQETPFNSSQSSYSMGFPANSSFSNGVPLFDTASMPTGGVTAAYTVMPGSGVGYSTAAAPPSRAAAVPYAGNQHAFSSVLMPGTAYSGSSVGTFSGAPPPPPTQGPGCTSWADQFSAVSMEKFAPFPGAAPVMTSSSLSSSSSSSSFGAMTPFAGQPFGSSMHMHQGSYSGSSNPFQNSVGPAHGP